MTPKVYERTLSDKTVIEVFCDGKESEVFIIQEGILELTSFRASLWDEYKGIIEEGIRSCGVTIEEE